MPRLPPSIIRSASRLNKYLPRLLQECGDLESACNELRWMKESILDKDTRMQNHDWDLDQSAIWSRPTSLGKRLERHVDRRARGEPLQYILGSQPFGELEIKCRPQVLIPRGETEIYTTQLAKFLLSIPSIAKGGLTIADFCTGSGCIALLLHSLLQSKSDQVQYSGQKLAIHGFDISHHALRLAGDNLRHNVSKQVLHENATSQISFHHADVLALASLPMTRISEAVLATDLDVIVSNPPYISPQHFFVGGPTSRSVRKFEPKLALVPPEQIVFSEAQQADQFYVALLRIAVATRTRLLAMEVGDTAQALRVVQICLNLETHIDSGFEIPRLSRVEIWKDDGQVVVADAAESMPVKVARLDALDEDPETECRAVVMWLDQDWISHRCLDTF